MSNQKLVDTILEIAEQSEDSLFELYKTAMAELKRKDISQEERKEAYQVVLTSRAYIKDKYCLKSYYHSVDYNDNPRNNPDVARFFQ